MTTEHAIPLEFRFAPATDQGRFKGIGNHYATTDEHKTRFAPGSFQRSLDAHQQRGTKPAMLWAHDPRKPIGEWLSIVDGRDGLEVEGQLVLDVQQAREALALMKRGLVGLSVGFNPVKQRRAADGVLEFVEVELAEISLVALPSNHKSTISEVRQMPAPKQIERALRDVGLSQKQAKAVMACGISGLHREGEDEGAAELAAGLRNILSSIRGKS